MDKKEVFDLLNELVHAAFSVVHNDTKTANARMEKAASTINHALTGERMSKEDQARLGQ